MSGAFVAKTSHLAWYLCLECIIVRFTLALLSRIRKITLFTTFGSFASELIFATSFLHEYEKAESGKKSHPRTGDGWGEAVPPFLKEQPIGGAILMHNSTIIHKLNEICDRLSFKLPLPPRYRAQAQQIIEQKAPNFSFQFAETQRS